ncbi:MAG: FHA domain-containing protein [Anaerolineaceae bacterium]
MAQELTCLLHGPYPASLGSCPRCAKLSGARPQDPGPIGASEDDMPTDYFSGAGQEGYQRPGNDDEAPTILPGGSGAPRRILDMDEQETDLGIHKYADDVTELEFEDVGPQAILWVKEGRKRGRIYKIKEETIIGRKAADLVLDDPKVSSTHAKIVVENGQYILIDFHSKNGTYVNGERIRAETTLKENDIIKIGDAQFVLKILE